MKLTTESQQFYIEKDEDNTMFIVRDPQNHPYAEVSLDTKNPRGHAQHICELLNKERNERRGK